MFSGPQSRMRRRRSATRPSLFSAASSSQYALAAIGVVLLLMVVEMTFDHPPHHHMWPVERYRSQNAAPMPDALRFDAMQLMIARDGRIFFGNTRVAASDLPDAIRRTVKSGSPRKVFFAVDTRAKYRDVSQALDAVQEAGVSDVAFLAEVPYIHR